MLDYIPVPPCLHGHNAYNALTPDQKKIVDADPTAKANLSLAQSKANTPAPAPKSTPKVKISTKSKAVKASKVAKKTQAFKIKYSKTKGSGKASFKKVGKSTKNRLAVTKDGKIKIKKGTKKGTYKIKVQLTVAANSKYNKKAVKKVITVKVK